MKITHEFLVRLVKALNTNEFGEADTPCPIPPINSIFTSLDRLDKEKIQPQLDKLIEKLRDPNRHKNTHELIMSIIEPTVIGVDDEGQEIISVRPHTHEEEWWARLTIQLDLVYLAHEVDFSNLPAPKDISKKLFIDNPAWSLNQGRRDELAQRALHFLGTINPYVFQWNGKSWRIIFEGRKIVLSYPYIGLHYYKYLLEHPSQKIKPFQLLQMLPGKKDYGVFSSSKRLENQYRSVGIQSTSEQIKNLISEIAPGEDMRLGPQYLIESKNREELKRMLNLIEEKLESSPGPEEWEKLEGSKKEIQKLLKSAFPNKAENARLAVIKATKRTRDAIRENNPEFAEFLNLHIKIAADCCYTPPVGKSISWKF